MQTPITRQQDLHFDTNTFATTPTTAAATTIRNDKELLDLVDNLIDSFPDYQSNMLNTSTQQQNQEDINKDIAINAITKSLMDIESSTAYNSPPAYPLHNVNNSQSNQQVCDIGMSIAHANF